MCISWAEYSQGTCTAYKQWQKLICCCCCVYPNCYCIQQGWSPYAASCRRKWFRNYEWTGGCTTRHFLPKNSRGRKITKRWRSTKQKVRTTSSLPITTLTFTFYLSMHFCVTSFFPSHFNPSNKLAISNYNIDFSKLCFHSPYAVNIHKPNETAFLFWCHALWNLRSSNCCIFKMKRSTGVETCTKIYFLIVFNLVKIRIHKILLSWLYNLMTSLWKSSTRNQEIGFWELIKWSPKRKCFFFYLSFSTTYC